MPKRMLSALLPSTAVVVAIIGMMAAGITGWLAKSATQRATDVRLIELGIGVLHDSATKANRPLRAWAIRLINRYSEEKIDGVTARLLQDSLALPVMVVDSTGLVRALRPGTATINACVDGKCASATVTVRDTTKSVPKRVQWRTTTTTPQ